jgi:hypothetical protein
MYFDQFLAWFGASILGGVFTNVWEDLKDGVPQAPPEWKNWPTLNTQNIDASKEPLRVSASFTNSARWTVTFTHDASGDSVSFNKKSDEIDLLWYGLSENGSSYMPQGFYTLTISAQGLASYSAKVWLGRPYAPSLMEGNKLLVDDFADGDLIPYIGKEWTNYLNNPDGGSPSTGEFSVGKGSDGKDWLSWKYTLGVGQFPYAALEWNCEKGSPPILNMTGVDGIEFVAKSSGGNINGVAVQLISTDFSSGEYLYYVDSIQLTTTSKTYSLLFSEFKQRDGGSGKLLSNTLKSMTGIRFHMQNGDNSTGTIMLERMYFTGNVSGIYNFTNPPAYVEPSGPIPPPPTRIISIAQHSAYSIKKSMGMVHITLQPNMAGANAVVMDAKGRQVKKMNVPQNAHLDIATRDLANGIYFVHISGPGMPKLTSKFLLSY